MKVACPCGHFIPDNTDHIPYKAFLFADQDWGDLLDAIEANLMAIEPDRMRDKIFPVVANTLRAYKRAMYRCSRCGRLLVQKRGEIFEFHSFEPDDRADSEGALRSVKQSRWQGALCGHWGEGSLSDLGGSIWWECGDGESGIEEFSSWDAITSRYREKFAAFRERDVLRGAFLKKDGQLVHVWPPKPGVSSDF